MIKEIIKEVKTIEYYCDICSIVTNSTIKCILCQINLCYTCTITDYSDSGDCSNKYCKFCWGIGKDIREKINDVELRAQDEIGELEGVWREKAVQAFNNRKENK